MNFRPSRPAENKESNRAEKGRNESRNESAFGCAESVEDDIRF